MAKSIQDMQQQMDSIEGVLDALHTALQAQNTAIQSYKEAFVAMQAYMGLNEERHKTTLKAFRSLRGIVNSLQQSFDNVLMANEGGIEQLHFSENMRVLDECLTALGEAFGGDESS